MWVEGSLDSAVWRLENGDELSSFGRNILKPKQCLASENGKLISMDCGLKLDFACQVCVAFYLHLPPCPLACLPTCTLPGFSTIYVFFPVFL